MQAEITKSLILRPGERVTVSMSKELHHLMAVEAAKRRLKVKDMIHHFCSTGLQNLGVDVSAVVEEKETEHKEVA